MKNNTPMWIYILHRWMKVCPMAEMSSYAIDLRAMTQARGSFTLEFARYEEVPKQNQAKIIEDAKNDEE